MALAGHELAIYANATTITAADEMDGVNNVSFGPTRDLLEDTDFKDTSATRTRFAGLKDGTISLSGDYEPADTPQSALETAFNNGTDITIGIAWDGATGSNGHQVVCQVESFEISASFDGKVEFSASLQFNGASSTFNASAL